MEEEFNVTAIFQIFQRIKATTEEEAIIQMKDYLDETGEGGAFEGVGLDEDGKVKIMPNTRYLINIKCEKREEKF